MVTIVNPALLTDFQSVNAVNSLMVRANVKIFCIDTFLRSVERLAYGRLGTSFHHDEVFR